MPEVQLIEEITNVTTEPQELLVVYLGMENLPGSITTVYAPLVSGELYDDGVPVAILSSDNSFIMIQVR